MNDYLTLELCKIQAIASCLDDAITNAMTYNPSEAGDRAVCLLDLLREHLDKLLDGVEHPGRDAA